MTALSENLLAKYYANIPRPYKLFERAVEAQLSPEAVLLDAGSGRTVPVLRKFVGRAKRLIGVELVDFTDVPPGIESYNTDLAHLPLPDAAVDIIMSRRVFEHLSDPESVYREFARVLRPGGVVVFLTANMWDYGTVFARLIPNRFLARIVSKVEGRAQEDTFPTEYRTNAPGDVEKLALRSGLKIEPFKYLGQYPNYLMFNGVLFFIGTCPEKLISRFDVLRLLRGWILVTLRKP